MAGKGDGLVNRLHKGYREVGQRWGDVKKNLVKSGFIVCEQSLSCQQ